MRSVQTTDHLMSSMVSTMRGSRADLMFESAAGESDSCLDLQYLGHLQVAVNGQFTGSLYRFSPLQPVQQVHARDAFYLLETGLFGIAL
jgi:hypothetical protein